MTRRGILRHNIKDRVWGYSRLGSDTEWLEGRSLYKVILNALTFTIVVRV